MGVEYTDFYERTVRGDTIKLDVTVTRDGSAVNLTGADAWCTGKTSVTDDDADAVFQVSTDGGGITVVDAPAGELQVVVPASATASLTAAAALWCDVQVIESDGTVTTVATGRIDVVPDITRATS